MRHILSTFSFAALLSVSVAVQTPPNPKPSQHGEVSQRVAGTTIALSYNRPVARGRELFGQLVPYGKVWCPCADDATTIAVSTDIKVNGETLPAGTYSVWTEPQPDAWTIIAGLAHTLSSGAGCLAREGHAANRTAHGDARVLFSSGRWSQGGARAALGHGRRTAGARSAVTQLPASSCRLPALILLGGGCCDFQQRSPSNPGALEAGSWKLAAGSFFPPWPNENPTLRGSTVTP
jgi:Protein of unknown function (DUF2911)